MWALLLLLVIAPFVTGNQTWKKFGCTFMNEQRYGFRTKSVESVFETVFGEEVTPLAFTNVTTFIQWIDLMQIEYTQEMARFVVDDFQIFDGFYRKLRESCVGEKSFESFYREYIPEYLLHADSVSLSISLLYHYILITRNFRNIGKHCYLVTATRDISEESANELIDNVLKNTNNIQESYPLPPDNKLFTHNHVAAVINITIEGRPGIILLDSGANMRGPVVIMEDEKYPHMYSKEPQNSDVQKVNEVKSKKSERPSLLKRLFSKTNSDSKETQNSDVQEVNEEKSKESGRPSIWKRIFSTKNSDSKEAQNSDAEEDSDDSSDEESRSRFSFKMFPKKKSDRPKTRIPTPPLTEIPTGERNRVRITKLTREQDNGTFLMTGGYIFNRQNATNCLYYVRRPYCSFMMSTTKRQLVMNPLRSIVRRDIEGHSTASISFNMMNTTTSLQLKMTYVHNNTEYYTKDINYKTVENFANDMVTYILDKREVDFYMDVMEKIKYTKSKNQIWSANKIANDVNFIEEYKILNEYMKRVIEEGKRHFLNF